MIDLLGRAGKIERMLLVYFMKQSPSEPSLVLVGFTKMQI